MDSSYFHARTCVYLAQYGKQLHKNLGAYSETLGEALDALQLSSRSVEDSMIKATDELVGEFLGDIISSIVIECMQTPKAARRREDPLALDYSNMKIREGYANDIFVLCGGIELKK